MYLKKTCTRRFNTGVSLKNYEITGNRNTEYIELQIEMIRQFTKHLSNEYRIIDFIIMHSDEIQIQTCEDGVCEIITWEIDSKLCFK